MTKKSVKPDNKSLHRGARKLTSADNCEHPRRRLLQYLTAAGAIVTVKALPNRWTQPVVDSVVLPAHAQSSPALAFSGAGVLPISVVTRDGVERLYAMQPEENHGLLDLLVPQAQASEESMIFATYYLSPEDVLTYKNVFVLSFPCSEISDVTNPDNSFEFTFEACWEGAIGEDSTNIPSISCLTMGSAPARIVAREAHRVLVEVFGEQEYLEPGGHAPTCACLTLDDFLDELEQTCGISSDADALKKFDPRDFLPPRYK